MKTAEFDLVTPFVLVSVVFNSNNI